MELVQSGLFVEIGEGENMECFKKLEFLPEVVGVHAAAELQFTSMSELRAVNESVHMLDPESTGDLIHQHSLCHTLS